MAALARQDTSFSFFFSTYFYFEGEEMTKPRENRPLKEKKKNRERKMANTISNSVHVGIFFFFGLIFDSVER
jgi:hypothetical protein